MYIDITVIAIILVTLFFVLNHLKRIPKISNVKFDNINVIKKGTGDKSIMLASAGENKVTVLATIRQILDLSLVEAKNIVENAPCTMVESVSEAEALATKEALEFVGAKVEII